MVAVLRANDIDLSPAVTYRLDRPSDYFSLDTYTGQLILLKGPEEEDDRDVSEMTLSAVASDSVHEARTRVEVRHYLHSCTDLIYTLELPIPIYTWV